MLSEVPSFDRRLGENPDAIPESGDGADDGGLDDETYRTLQAFNVAVQPGESTAVETELSHEKTHDAPSAAGGNETGVESATGDDSQSDADNQSNYAASQDDGSQKDEDEIQAEEIQPEEPQGEPDADKQTGTPRVASSAPSELHVETEECLYCSEELPKDEIFEAPCAHGMCQPCLINEKTCSAFIPLRFIEAGVARCTRCEKKTCLNCQSKTHQGVCADDTESQRVVRLAEEHVWRRCEQCKNMVELTHGCFHVPCRCKYQFCYLCGKQWKTCDCPHWDEHRLMMRAGEIAAAPAQLARPNEPIGCRHRDVFDRVDGEHVCDDYCDLEVCHDCLYTRRRQWRLRH
ncbi:uncharacterized protein BKA55DRAFT_592299 [Fusarium redolens]|uniref:RING-type domain-containing protein n=1 Tax=Fusarium redolens TaxID=48865 RepID=A0A9P9HNC5_FUSRE|nr:uncharacterized protein BKA55DRAFT_592299 [Fusarium redolens]KAH7259584.1 hypothetical protein BKA55DRAFT_592299 [Fusarium redolens]